MQRSQHLSNGLLVGTTAGELAYHACRRPTLTGEYARALCGLECHLTPRPWDEERQKRQDSCHLCARKVRAIWKAAEDERLAKGPLVAAYLRASTDRQTESPDTQLGIIETYCRRQGLPAPVVYSDPAVSGNVPLPEREAGGRMLADLRKGDHCIVARLDRLTRNFLDFAYVIDRWSKAGVSLHPCDFPMVVKPNDPLSNAFIHMLALFSSHERKLIGQRIKEGLAHRKAQGRKIGHDAPWGFKHERRGPYWYRVEDPHQSTIALKCAELSLAGFGTTRSPTQHLGDQLRRGPRRKAL
jgi:DNA invertase Pin-like site-specific DNA recombinase